MAEQSVQTSSPNPYIDSDLMDAQQQYSPQNNKLYENMHTIANTVNTPNKKMFVPQTPQTSPQTPKTRAPNAKPPTTDIHFLMYGHKGWIGGHIVNHIKAIQKQPNSAYNIKLSLSQIRVDNASEVEKEIRSVAPTHIISTLGRTHGLLADGTKITTIDYLESLDKTYDNIHDNLYAPMTLALLCLKYDIHFTYLGTGCIFHYDREQNDANEYDLAQEFKESDRPNFFGSQYSIMKGFTDQLMHIMEYSQKVLNVRIRMPITDELFCDRNLIAKLVSYKKIVNIPNSMTNLDELLPVMVDMALTGKYGTIHLCNPGAMCHDEILELYRDIVDGEHKWEKISVDELKKKCKVKAERSNNALCAEKLLRWYPNVKDVRESVKDAILRMKMKGDMAANGMMEETAKSM